MKRWLALLAACLGVGCSTADGPIPEPPGGSVAVSADTSLSFYIQIEVFYGRLVRRRFNTLETFNDPVLRDQFRTENHFFDYYADLAESLRDAHFERNRPVDVAVRGFVFETPESVRVQVRFLGEDNRPLRPNKTSLIRLDRWERSDGRWWMTPGKL
ncbi:MAG: hypothetical protein ACE5FL_16500 [Myxococcota bacterium]